MPNCDFDALYEAHAKTVYWTAYGVSRDSGAAQEVVQNVFLRAFQHLSTLSELSEEQRRAWLCRAAINSGIDGLRRNKRYVIVEDAGVNEADGGQGPEEAAVNAEFRRTVRAGVDGLPEKYRMPILLYYFAELDYHSIAMTLGISEGTLKSRMSRGRQMLKKELMKGGALREA